MTIRARLGTSARGTPRVPHVESGAQGAQGFQGATGAQGAQGATGTQVVADLAALALLSGVPNGAGVYVLDQGETYRLDAANAFTVSSPLIIAALDGGRWFRRSKAYVVGNFTLWAQAFGLGVAGFTPGQLTGSHALPPDIVLDMRPIFSGPGTRGDETVITDNLGNLWVGANNDSFSTIGMHKYLLQDCLASGAPSPAVSLTVPVPASSETAGAVFDKLNGLWVMNGSHGTFGVSSFVRYSQKDYLLNLGTPSTTLVAFSPGLVVPSTSNQQDCVIDGQGNLWFTIGFSGDPTGPGGGVVMFSADQLRVGGPSVVPSVFWHGSNFTGVGVGSTSGVAISPAGLLWVTSIHSNTLKAWDMRQPSNGNPAPVITLTCSNFVDAYGIAFDAHWNLWVNSYNASQLQRIPAASLLTSGAVTADIVLSQTAVALESKITFPNNPDRSGLLPSGVPFSP